MNNKNRIDEDAERESKAIYRLRDLQADSRKRMSGRTERVRQAADYNQIIFDRLFSE